MRVSFIGMSNIGKSYWAKRLTAEESYACINCDAMIERELAPELVKGGYVGLRGVAQWMGFPDQADYSEKSALYMAKEKVVMQETMGLLEKEPKVPTVVDTTGSVIYTGDKLLADLRRLTCVVFFEASDAYINDLFKRYLAHPKPTIWGGHYKPSPNETPEQTLKRCYPELLHERTERYKAAAHVTIPFERHRDRNANIGALLKEYVDAL